MHIVIKRKNDISLNEKKQMVVNTHRGDYGMISALFPFIKLPDTFFKIVLNWRERDWMNYGDLCEWELYANRHLEDVPEDKRSPTDDREDYGDVKETLTLELFKKFNKIPQFTYEMYALMSKINN
jgi:hypothetical protein